MARVLSQEEAARLREKAKSQGKKVVFTNGCFDLLHRGHVEYLMSARKLGDMLIVGVNSDSSVRKIKGPQRPLTSLRDRMAVLASLECVDCVVSFEEDTPGRLIELLVPDVLVKGGDWRLSEVVGRETVEKNGGEVIIIDFLDGYSTRDIIKKIVDSYCDVKEL